MTDTLTEAPAKTYVGSEWRESASGEIEAALVGPTAPTGSGCSSTLEHGCIHVARSARGGELLSGTA